jgi:predicted oxidoreductase
VGSAPVIGTARSERVAACRDAALREPDLAREEWHPLWGVARGVPPPLNEQRNLEQAHPRVR